MTSERGNSNAERIDRGMRADRGVSEVVGFILMFSVVLLSVIAVYTAGMSALLEISDHAEVNSATDAMEALAVSFQQIGRSDGVGRSNEIRLNGGQISVEEGSTFEVDIEVSDGPDPPPTNVTTGAIHIDIERNRVSYAGGAVFRVERGGSVMTHAPAITCDEEQAIVSLIVIRANGNVTAVDRVGSVVVNSREVSSALLYPGGVSGTYQPAGNATTVTIKIESSPNADEWGKFLTSNGWTKSGSTTYTCSTDHVIFRKVVLSVWFS